MRISATISVICSSLAVAACALPDADSFRIPDSTNLFRRLSVTSYAEKPLPPVAAADLVDTSGRCAGAYVTPSAGDSGAVTLKDAGVPLIPAAVGLEMTECDVVKRVGVPERVEIGTNDRQERTATLTYLRGDRPGVYSFTTGRLKSMEMVAAAAEPVKTTKKGKPAKPPKPSQRAAQPTDISVQ